MLDGIWAKMTWSKGLFVLWVFILVWTASLFLAPLTIAPGSFAWTMGGANTVDHWDVYERPAFNAFAQAVYVIGDAQCHQMWTRSLWINGNQMPIDARMTSLYIFGAIGLFWAMMTPPSSQASMGIANAFPGRIRRWATKIGVERFALLVVLLGILPVAIDGFTQLFASVTQYESTNAVRVLTGVTGGLVIGLLLGMMIKSIKAFDLEYKAFRESLRVPTETRSGSSEKG